MENNNSPKRVPAVRSRRGRGLRVTLIILICLVGLMLAATAASLVFLTVYKPTITRPEKQPAVTTAASGDVTTAVEENEVRPPVNDSSVKTRRDDIYTFLIVGRDAIALNTDVIMLASFDTANHRITVLQIPRDTYIYQWGGPHKINSIFSNLYVYAVNNGSKDYVADGMRGFADVMAQGIGVPVDFYIHVDLEAFRNVIDILGGVDLYVPFHMVYEDPGQNLYIDLPEGQTHLDGAKAEQFVRFRHGYPSADLGRMDAQRTFLSALATQLRSRLGSDPVSTVSDLASQAFKHVKTDLTALDFVYFAKEYLAVQNEDIRMMRIVGGSARLMGDYGQSYQVLHRADFAAAVSTYFNVYEEPFTEEDFDPKRIFTDDAKQWFRDVYYTPAAGDTPENVEDIAEEGVTVPHY